MMNFRLAATVAFDSYETKASSWYYKLVLLFDTLSVQNFSRIFRTDFIMKLFHSSFFWMNLCVSRRPYRLCALDPDAR